MCVQNILGIFHCSRVDFGASHVHALYCRNISLLIFGHHECIINSALSILYVLVAFMGNIYMCSLILSAAFFVITCAA